MSEARRNDSREHQKACVTVLPAQDVALRDCAVPQPDEESAHVAMLVVPVPKPDSGAPPQDVSGVAGPAEDSAGGWRRRLGGGRSGGISGTYWRMRVEGGRYWTSSPPRMWEGGCRPRMMQ